MSHSAELLGNPVARGVLIIADHASAAVPDGIDLGIADELLALHIAQDIGVAEVSALLLAAGAVDAAWIAKQSRLVIDLNRDEDAAGLIPQHSDGHAIPGNKLDVPGRRARMALYRDYHEGLAALLDRMAPAMILSLHSFTPALASAPDVDRPWQLGVLYNDDDRLARLAIPAFAALGLNVGDQLPYSGRDLNYTMNHHAEARAIPYLGLEMRQDMVRDGAGQARFAAMIGRVMQQCRHFLAETAALRQ